MRALRLTSAFRRDLKRIAKRGYDQGLLETLVDDLRHDRVLPLQRRDHPLKGEWQTYRECHIQPDWLLIYKAEGDELVLYRTGTHSDLFDL